MPQPEQFGRTVPAVLWVKTGVDRYNTTAYEGACEIVVRWSRKRVERRNPDNTTTVYDGSLVVDREIPDGSLVFRGRLADLDPTVKDQVIYRTAEYSEVDDVKGREVMRTCKVERYAGDLPSAQDDPA